MPVDLYDPDEEGKPVEMLAGDPFPLQLVLVGQDRSGSTFTSQLRYRPCDADVVVECDVSAFYVDEAAVTANPSLELVVGTYIRASVPGDSLAGAIDGETRLSQRTAKLDIQEWDGTDGSARQTIATADINLTWDVTR